jgi:hypothetical protein
MEQTHMARHRMVVSTCIEDRSDGGLRVYSEMLPGLMLSGKDSKAVCRAIGPAIRALFEAKGVKIAGVYPNKPMLSIMKLPSPRTVDMRVEQFVVEVKVKDAA